MEAILDQIKQIVEKKKIPDAERTIMSLLIDLDSFFDGNIEDSITIEQILLSIFTINGGNFSIQCSEFISSKLLKLYQKSKEPKLWDMINFAIQNSYSSTIIATAYICKFIGETNKAQLPRFIEHILKNCAKFQFASIYALRIAFKVGGKAVSQFQQQAFDFTTRILSSGDVKQHTVMISLKFLRTLVNSCSVSAQLSATPSKQGVQQQLEGKGSLSINNASENIINNNVSSSGDGVQLQSIIESTKNCLNSFGEQPFIQNEVAVLVAKCAYKPFLISHEAFKKTIMKKLESVENWSDASNRRHFNQVYDFTQCLSIINMFPSIILQAFSHFIDRLGPETTSQNHIQLFKYARIFIPDAVPKLIPLLPGDSQFTYFREISKEEASPKQLRLLKILSPDDNCIKEAATIALKLAVTSNKESRKEAVDLFSKLSRSHPFLVSKHVSSCLSSLKNSLSELNNESPEFVNRIYGNTAVITAILSNLADKDGIIHENKSLLESFIKSVLTTPNINPNNPLFISLFTILITLPKQYAALSIVSKAIDTIIATCKQPSKKLLKAVFQFRSKFSKLSQNAKLVDYALKLKSIKINNTDDNNKSNTVTSDLPKSVLMNLCSMIPKLDSNANPNSNSEFAFKTAQVVLNRVLKLKPSQPLVKSFFKRPLPLASELLGVKKKEFKTDPFLSHVIRKFPLLVAASQPNDRKVLLSTVLEPKSMNITKILIIASLSEAKITRNFLPLNLHNYLISLLKSKSTKKDLLQPICEVLGLFARSHPSSLPDLFDFIEGPIMNTFAASTSPNVSESNPLHGSLLLSAIFAHMTVPKQFIIKAITYLDQQMASYSTAAIAVHALESVILTHSMQLSAMNSVLSSQFNHIFISINSSSSLQPVTLKIISDCFRSLIETFSSELVDSSSQEARFVRYILKAIEMTPIGYAKEVYFECCRSIYAFSHSLTQYAPISFPSSHGASVNCQLAACAAFSDYMKFETLNPNAFEIETLVPHLLTLLQSTGDIRVHNFLVSIASTMDESKLSFWVSTVRRVLVTSSLIDSTSLAIEPTHEVKRACVDISMYIVDILGKTLYLSTENLDDIISSLCRANETGSVQLQEAAFPVLQKVIELFKDRPTAENNGRLLDLYDSQFASVVKVGFQLNLAISGGFLSTYLTFNTDNMSKDPENCSAILVVYLNGLDGCQQRSTPFYSLATHLCTVGRKYPQIRSLIQPFLVTLTPIFSQIVLDAMKLWKSNDDWRAMNNFRSLVAPFYAELLPAFVWLQTISQQNIVEVDVLVSFFVIEMKMSRESWQATAAFEALLTAFDFCGAQISSGMLELGIKSAINFSGSNEKQMLINSSALLKDGPEWDNLRECILSLCCDLTNQNDKQAQEKKEENASFELVFDPFKNQKGSSSFGFDAFGKNNVPEVFSPKTLAYLLKSDLHQQSLHRYSFFIATFIVNKFKEGKITIDVSNALFILLFEHTHSIITQVCNYVIGMENLAFNFKMMVVTLALSRIQEKDSLGQIPRFLLSSFRVGGMHLIAHFLKTRPILAFALLSKGTAKAAFILPFKDLENARAFLWFLQLSLKTMEKTIASLNSNDKALTSFGVTVQDIQKMAKHFACSVFRLALKIIEKFGNDQINGRMIVWHCIRMIQDTQRIAGNETIKNVFESEVGNDDERRKNCFSILKISIHNEIQNKKMQELVEFSSNERGKRNDENEWETLEIGDSD